MNARHYSICLTPDTHKQRSMCTLTPSKKPQSQASPHDYTPSRQGSKSIAQSKPFTPSFVSVYGKETRFEQVMKIKARPVTGGKNRAETLLALQEKSQIEIKQEPSRFQKIMSIKVPKPSVVSTLNNYQPRVVPRKMNHKENHPPQERLWEVQQAYKRQQEAKQRAQRQWRLQQRQREQQLQRKRREAEIQNANQRRKETQFQALVQKQVLKIQKQRQLSQRKNGGFTIYIYPEC